MIGLEMMKQCRKSRIDQRGFTMIEMVAVLIVMAIVGVLVVSRYTMGSEQLIAETDALKSSLRYAQIQSMQDDTDTDTNPVKWGIHLSSDGGSYVLYKNNAPAIDGSSNPILIPVKLPDATNDPPPVNQHYLQKGVQIKSGRDTTVNFDKWGRPLDESGNLRTLNIGNLILSQRGNDADPIIVTRNTGYIP
jgi:prepilin-type N-terminal cleavage/methylation domain-containing protein